MKINRLISNPFKRDNKASVKLDVIAFHDLKAFAVLTPKCACSSLTSIAVDILGFNLPEGAWKPGVFRGKKFDNLIDTEIRDAAFLDTSRIGLLEGYWGFTAVRNPYDRLVSCFSEKIRDDGPSHIFRDGVSRVLSQYGVFRRGMTFAEFVSEICKIEDSDADPHFRSQSSMLCKDNGEIIVHKICRVESLTQDIQEIAKHLEAKIEVPHLLKSNRSEWQSYYTPSLKSAVYERYEDDFELFGYEK